MEKNVESSSLGHKEWRRIAKRERRRRVRRKAAQERDSNEERLRATLESTAEYSNWISERDNEKRELEIAEKREHEEREKLWLEEEVQAQKEWRIHQQRKAQLRREQLIQDEIIRKDFEKKQEALRMKKEEAERQRDEEIKKHRDIQKEIDDYIDNGCDTPEFLRVVSETQSSKDPCPFFTKTGACRYGDICSRNHRRLALSKVILVPGFYSHFSLEKTSAEYDTDISLEFESSETRRHFREFYESVLPELESFGRIKTLKFCRNTEIHLRGNLYIEYQTEREAARAWRKLKGRYYAQRQLNCEFVNLTSWRNAVCGMTKCPKGRACNFLHTFRNPNDEYDIKSPPRWVKKNENSDRSSSRRSERRSKSKWDDWDRASTDDSRNWRWSESPETETDIRGKSERSRSSLDERGDRRHDSRSDRKRDSNERSGSRSSRRDYDSQKRENSSKRSKRREYSMERDENSSRKREKKSRKRHTVTRSDEEITQRDSDIRKLKKSKSKFDEERRGERKIMRKKSRHESRTEREESDENVDTNSNNSRTSVSKEIGKMKNDEKSNNEKKNSSTPPVVQTTTSSASENEWDTTDSE